ncbi:MAG: dihydroorotate dehydrogenase electron transfer subunit [Planctomycetaceae bacterium]|nr:dihydroorotate dehydrogenase electron transfer subunit [Planctomycetaceae bacterium]
MNPLHAKSYADQAVQRTVEIVENARLAKDTYRVRFKAPEIARRIVPGQFLMLRITDLNDPLIGRPLALYDTVVEADGRPEAVDVVYLVKGKLTSRLWQMQAGQRVDVWGPLGNGFCQEPGTRGQEPGARNSTTHHSPLTTHSYPPIPTEHLIMVAGGIGQTPFLALAQEALHRKRYGEPPRDMPRARRVTLCYGARTAEYLACVEDFQRLGVEIRLATDDGSLGHHGLVTDLLQQCLAEHHGRPHIVCCGPEPMMAAAAKIAHEARIPCQVSLETPMACGVGICFTCVAKIRQPDGSWDYKRTCVDGPVFDAELVEW